MYRLPKVVVVVAVLLFVGVYFEAMVLLLLLLLRVFCGSSAGLVPKKSSVSVKENKILPHCSEVVRCRKEVWRVPGRVSRRAKGFRLGRCIVYWSPTTTATIRAIKIDRRCTMTCSAASGTAST
jgi:hypothetical protein